MTESEKRLHRCCFTGHRPEKLHMEENEIIPLLRHYIETAVSNGFTTFISGMAKGVDIWAAEIVLQLRLNDPRIRLISALPFPDFGQHWEHEWTNRFRKVLAQSDYVRSICPQYSRECFQKRNEWMVNHSKLLIAAYNGEKGGTRNTIEYAKHIPDLEIFYLPLK